MRRHVLAAVLLALLAAAIPAPAANKVDTDFNPNADFKAYKTWDWVPNHDVGHHGVLAGEVARGMVERALTGELNRVGLRRVAAGETADLLVRYWGDIAEGKSGIQTTAMGGYDPYTGGYYGDMFRSSVHYTEQMATIIVDLIDPKTKDLAWRAFITQKYGTPSMTSTPVADALTRAFDEYPPTAKEIARKKKDWEKRAAAK